MNLSQCVQGSQLAEPSLTYSAQIPQCLSYTVKFQSEQF